MNTTQMRKQAPKLEKAVQAKLGEISTTSGKIRFLDSEGFQRADIARILDKRYQHVKNVLDKPLKSA